MIRKLRLNHNFHIPVTPYDTHVNFSNRLFIGHFSSFPPSAAHPRPSALSQQPLSRKLDLARSFAGLEAALGHADPLPLGQLDLVLVRVPGAGAVVREVDAGEGVGAEVLVATRCTINEVSLDSLE